MFDDVMWEAVWLTASVPIGMRVALWRHCVFFRYSIQCGDKYQVIRMRDIHTLNMYINFMVTSDHVIELFSSVCRPYYVDTRYATPVFLVEVDIIESCASFTFHV